VPTLIDGSPCDSVSASDRGLRYGDGLFETVLWSEGALRFWPQHLERLRSGCLRLGLAPPAASELEHDLQALLAVADRHCQQHAVFRVQVTAGDGGRGYGRGAAPQPRRIASLTPLPRHPLAHWTEGVALHPCRLRLGHQPALAGLKHCNRLEYVLARGEWSDPAIAEGLLLDTDGHVIEGIHMNTFALRGATLLVPALDRCGVAGVMRAHLIETAHAAGLDVVVGAHALRQWLTADAVLMSNALVGVWPVRRIGELAIGSTATAATRRRIATLIGSIPGHHGTRAAMSTPHAGSAGGG
jgi:4-amino-4-deoxychorismate lyase